MGAPPVGRGRGPGGARPERRRERLGPQGTKPRNWALHGQVSPNLVVGGVAVGGVGCGVVWWWCVVVVGVWWCGGEEAQLLYSCTVITWSGFCVGNEGGNEWSPAGAGRHALLVSLGE